MGPEAISESESLRAAGLGKITETIHIGGQTHAHFFKSVHESAKCAFGRKNAHFFMKYRLFAEFCTLGMKGNPLSCTLIADHSSMLITAVQTSCIPILFFADFLQTSCIH